MTGATGKLVMWLMAAGVPAIGLGVGWAGALAHPVLAGALTIAYLACLAAIRFTVEVTRDVGKRWQGRVANWLDRLTLRWLSRFARRYRAAMRVSTRFVDLKGLSVLGFCTPELDEVFVDVSLERRAPGQVSGGLVPSEGPRPDDRLWLGDLVNQQHPVILAVLGAPGSGKTTLLRHTTRRLGGSRRPRRSIPVLLYLRDHAAAIVADPNLALPDLARQQADQYGVGEPPGWFERQLRKGRCVVQLDGFDEVATRGDRRAVASWVERQVVRYSHNDFVITSRPHGYRDAPVAGATVVKTRNFTDEQVSTFVQAWYLAVEKQDANRDAESLAKARSADLLDRLKRSADLYKLTVNPLLLTMIANVHRERGALPGSRVDLYAEICQVVLGHRRSAVNLPDPLDFEARKAVLGGLALAMMSQRTSDLSSSDILAELRQPLRQLSEDRAEDLTAEWFLADVAATGMLIEREPDTYAFAHLTFQEYLAATHLHATQAGGILAGRVDDPWWRETTLLYAARSSAGPIVRACLDDGSTTALTLAFECAEQDVKLEAKLRRRLDEMLDRAFAEDLEPAQRQILAGVVVARDLRQRIRVGETAEVCRLPISNRIHALFRQTQASDKPTEPVRGIWGSEASKLVDWVNQVTGSGPTYRLPRRDEIEQPAVRQALAEQRIDCVWLDAGQELEPWTANGIARPHQLDGDRVKRQIQADLAIAPQLITYLLQLGVVVLVSYGDRVRAERIFEDVRRGCPSAEAGALGLNGDISRGLASKPIATGIFDSLDQHIEGAVASASPVAIAAVGKHLLQLILQESKDDCPKGISRPGALDSGRVDLSPIMGKALSDTVGCVLESRHFGDETRLPEEFAGSFSGVTGMLQFKGPLVAGNGTGSVVCVKYDVSPDSLSRRVEQSCAAVTELRKPPAGSWLHQAIDSLKRVGRTALATPERIAGSDATTGRMLALCVAGELDHGELKQAFHEIAAGITLRQACQGSEIWTREAIVLAVG